MAKAHSKVGKSTEPQKMDVDLTQDYEDNDLTITRSKEKSLDVQNEN